MSLKNPVTPPGIDAGTVRLVAQRLNHYATPGPTVWIMVVFYIREGSVHTIAGLVQVQHTIVKQNCPLKQVYKGNLHFNFNTSKTIFNGVLFSIIYFFR